MANLTLRNVDNDLLDKLKAETGEATYSKALVNAAERYPAVKAVLHFEKQRNVDLQLKIDRLISVIDSLNGLCIQVSEITGQKDLEL